MSTSGADYDLDWHNAPRRQFVVNLEGELEIIASDSTTRRFGAGEVFPAEDTTGKGHITRTVNKQPRRSLIVTLD